MRALDSERVDDLFYHTGSAPNLNVQMAHRTVLVHDEPVLDAELAVEFVTIVAFLCVTAHFETDLTEQVVCEGFVNLEDCN